MEAVENSAIVFSDFNDIIFYKSFCMKQQQPTRRIKNANGLHFAGLSPAATLV
jgi:hypothetical protein